MGDPFRVGMSGPLTPFMAGFREQLMDGGYRRDTAAKHLQLMAHLSRWMATHGVAPGALGRCEIEQFVSERRTTHRHRTSLFALAALLEHLRGLGVVPAPDTRDAGTPAGEL